MRFVRVLACLIVLLAAASAAELKIKVVDSQSAAVAGAQVELREKGNATPASLQNTSAEGVVTFRGLREASYVLRILAPGFAPETMDAPPSGPKTITVQLRLGHVSETVVVTATRSPIPSQAAGANVENLTGSQIEVMNPVALDDAVRFLPGAIIDTSGQRGGLSSLFVRGGDSRYNKVIVDEVPVNEPGGTMDLGVVPLTDADRLEFVRGAQSTLYGSDAMTSVVQVWTGTGSTRVPELRFGADGGTFETANGYASLAGAHGRFDYNLFGDQFNTNGQGPNAEYSNSLQGGNLGVALSDHVGLRLRVRHSNNRTGVPGEWNFNGTPLEPPDFDQWARQNNFLGSVQLIVSGPSRWQHRFTGYEYNHKRTNVDTFSDPRRTDDFVSHGFTNVNRAGFEYQGDFQQRTWARTTVGYEFEDENGFVGDLNFPPLLHGLRLNHAVYGQELLTLGRLSIVAGARFVHNDSSGNKGVPRVSLTLQALRGGQTFSGTQLRFSYATGFKEPRLEEAFAGPPFSVVNPNLRAERSRSFEAGVQQNLFGGKYALAATYYHNLFFDRVDYRTVDPINFIGQYVNVDKSFAQGAEFEFRGKLLSRLSLNSAYAYTSTQILEAPECTPQNFCDPLLAKGTPLLRRPKHSGTVLLTYLGNRWGGNMGGSFVGRRPDADFSGFHINHAAGYARVDVGGWYAINSRVTAYANIENALNQHYNEVVGYPALRGNFRLGMRFRLGGE
ncbi:MAG: TonB-dependent receptor [Acidobacteriia bacterium]|nr:TonB-dependent receptor [Terriglobia bacterium]